MIKKVSLQIVENWCRDLGIEFDVINDNLDPELNIREYGYSCRKVYADIYLDDKAMNI